MKFKILVVCIALFTAAAVPAFASVFNRGFDVSALAVGADAVVLGQVMSLQGAEMENGRIQTIVTVSVEEAFKGRFSTNQLIRVFVPGGVMEGRVEMVSSAPAFVIDERNILFLRMMESGAYQLYGMSLGKMNVYEDEDSGVELAVPDREDHTVHNAGVPESGYLVSDIIEQVELAVGR